VIPPTTWRADVARIPGFTRLSDLGLRGRGGTKGRRRIITSDRSRGRRLRSLGPGPRWAGPRTRPRANGRAIACVMTRGGKMPEPTTVVTRAESPERPAARRRRTPRLTRGWLTGTGPTDTVRRQDHRLENRRGPQETIIEPPVFLIPPGRRVVRHPHPKG
jgi:hypothetical protein